MQTNQDTTTIKIPQLMLVSLSFKFGRQGGQDSQMTAELCEKHNSDPSMTKATKRFICKEAYDPLKKIAGKFGTEVKRFTLTWDIDGVSFCKPVAVEKIIAKRDMYGPMFDEVKQSHLLARYDEWKELSKDKSGSAFKDDEFPSKEDLEWTVRWQMSIMPMAEVDAFRRIKEIDETLMQALEESQNKRVQDGIRNGMATAYTRLMAPLQHMVETLTDENTIKIHETLTGNVAKIIEEIPSLNLVDDPALAQFAEQARSLIEKINLDDLKGKGDQVKVVRRKVAQDAASVLATFGQMGLRRFTS